MTRSHNRKVRNGSISTYIVEAIIDHTVYIVDAVIGRGSLAQHPHPSRLSGIHDIDASGLGPYPQHAVPSKANADTELLTRAELRVLNTLVE